MQTHNLQKSLLLKLQLVALTLVALFQITVLTVKDFEGVLVNSTIYTTKICHEVIDLRLTTLSTTAILMISSNISKHNQDLRASY